MTLTAVPGVRVGHATLPDGTSGCTIVRCDGGARAGHHVPGGAVGSREWGLLEPDHLAPAIHGVVLSGGSAHGLATADGAMRVLAADGVGFDTGHGLVPLLPAAILFDLDVASRPPGAVEGAAAARAACEDPVPTGLVGAGAGARVGRGLGQPVPGGVGSASTSLDGHTVGALVALNAFGAVVDPATGRRLSHPVHDGPGEPPPGSWRGQTTLVVIATDLPLDRPSCRVLARMASAGLARTLRPAFTPFDGDVVFALSTGQGPTADPGTLLRAGDAAAAVLATAITGLYADRGR